MGTLRSSGALRWITGAIGLMLLALSLAYLMLFQVIPSTLFFNLVAVFGSMVGMVLGMYGTFLVYHAKRRRQRNPYDEE
jgi:pilus assembly protein TadC